MTVAVDQQAIQIAVTHQRCPRRRFLQYHLLGRGIELVYLDPVKTTRKWIARGIVALLTGRDFESVTRIVLKSFTDEFAERGIDPGEGDPFTIYTEQRALIEAVLLSYNRVMLKGMVEAYQPWTDNMLRDLNTGQMLSHVVRVVADADRDTLVRDLHSLHTVARAAFDAERWEGTYGGLLFQYVVTGDRRQRSGETMRTQRSPFITGYRQKVGGRMSPTLVRTDPRTGIATRLGHDYKLFRIWETRSPVTLDQWITMLDGWGQFKSLFPQVHVNPPEERDAREAIKTVEHQNSIVVPIAPSETSYLLSLFPMYRHSCDSPTICPYQQMDCCYGDISVTDPTSTGVYRQKEQHEHSSGTSE